jgi:hypothetical protein
VTSLSCPACGAPVEFRSAAPYSVCSHCQSLLVRKDVSLESLGRVAQVPEDFSPLQLHTTGTFEKRHFTLIGRIRKAWDEGSWNEWCALFDDQTLGWLAEAQGDLVMTFEAPLRAFGSTPSTESLRRALAGDLVPLNGKRFTVSDVKQVTCTGAEGELGAGLPFGAAMSSIDLTGPGLEFATIEITAANALHLFMGRYVEFTEVQFTGLRALGGWQ